MWRKQHARNFISRRTFLERMRWAPVLFVPSPFHSAALPWNFNGDSRGQPGMLPLADFRYTPHYPKKSPLDDILRYMAPGSDEFLAEKFAAEIKQRLEEWSKELRSNPRAMTVLAKSLAPSFQSSSFVPVSEKTVREEYGIETVRRSYSDESKVGGAKFLEQMRAYLSAFESLQTAEFQIVTIEEKSHSPLTVQSQIRYELVGICQDGRREERIGNWNADWMYADSTGWQILRLTATQESLSRARLPVFLDVTEQALGNIESYKTQLLPGTDDWRTVLDGACGVDVYGNTGIAAGDYNNDALDDLYICQPPSLPNRLYRNRGDGTFEDVTEAAGVGVLDGTACALFADFENKGLQDLLVVCATGPLLFLNQGNGKFALKRDAFQFAKPPSGAFTHASVADYDKDGKLDIYFGVYNYYLGLDQYHYPVPYFDARNGPPNFLLHNEGNATFVDRTEAAGLNVDNDRYTFSCVWGDYNNDGWPDLYVVNDFGRNCLYRNNTDGTFTAVSSEAHVEDVGAGMSACWLDFDNDGNQDIHAAGMWVAAGMRVFGQQRFHGKQTEAIRALYRRHMTGNSLYRNLGTGKFQNVAEQAGIEMGRWAWSTDALDFDHDGYPDLYVANGYISGSDNRDASSFFWRQVVAKSPQTATPSENYERGWNAINEAIRSDATWNGFERNVFYWNNRDGTFSSVSGSVGLDFLDDSRTFVLADLDWDGRLEIVLKNRTAPQIRVLRNAMTEIGNSIVFRLRGTKSNRDAIGAAVTVEANGRRQTKLLQAGSGFLAQHSKEVFFGVGATQDSAHAIIHWPSGQTQTLEKVPINHRIEVQEGTEGFRIEPFARSAPAYERKVEPSQRKAQKTNIETWLVQPLQAQDFSLPDLNGTVQKLSSFREHFVLLHFCAMEAPDCAKQLQLLEKHQAELSSHDARILCVDVDAPEKAELVRSFALREKISFPILLASDEVAGIYNILVRYLFDRRRDMLLPTSFLVDRNGLIVKIYQGEVRPKQVLEDLGKVPKTPAEFLQNGLPMKGTAYLEEFRRNDFTYGVAFFQRGYLDAAASTFRQAIEAKRQEPEAYYNLGTLYLMQSDLPQARHNLEQALKLRPEYAEAWNNLGMVSAQEGQESEAIQEFQKSLALRPTYVIALLNYGNLLRRKGDLVEAQQLLTRAVELKPDDADANYSLGMLYARQNEIQRASEYLEKAISLRPDHAEALNNLGVLLARQNKLPEAKEKFETCIRVAPKFDQAYINLAGLYALLNEKEKAREVLQDLLRQQPDHKLARQTLEMLN
jgi:Flp pilus assembly protein TadD/peroxiredoxin